MQKRLLLSIVALIACFSSFAQFNYTLTVQNQTYTPLTGGTSLNDTIRWDDDDYTAPLGFNFDMDGVTGDSLYMLYFNYMAVDTVGTVNVFAFTDLDLWDRGSIDDTESLSPVSYLVTGTMPNRIFKLEIANAGIYEEYDLHSTNNDSLNMQIWLYETSNIIEFHYGPTKLTYPSDYHFTTGSPVLAYIKGYNDWTGSLDKGYYLKGAATAPTIDSFTNPSSLTGGLNTYPANGTVYRFTPKPAGVKDNAGMLNKIILLSNAGTSELLLSNPYKGHYSYKIVGLNGAVISDSRKVGEGLNKIDISYLPQGMHILYVSGEEGMQAFRINKL